MSASVDRLRDTLGNASGQPLTLEYISRIALLSRHVVEEENAKQKLSVLQLYCNWLLHPRIDQSATADKILASIDDIFFVRQKVTTLSPQNVQSAMGFRVQFDGGEHGLLVVLENQGEDLDHLAVAARRLEHTLL
jgi:hypothetical protein